ncbi:MAG: hypothetical protein IK095_04980 [Oscillospiraceae bacterium]|nr:hypothetical protein [Oscillospiraceae bacterium]
MQKVRSATPPLKFFARHPLILWILAILALIVFLALMPYLFPWRGMPELPAEPNTNNDRTPFYGHGFWAVDGEFYYLQDGFYNMGAYRSTGTAAKRIFQSSDFSSREGDEWGRLGSIFPCNGQLYFELYAGNRTNFYAYDPAQESYRYLCHAEHVDTWIVHEHYLIYQEDVEREGLSKGFEHDALWIHDLDSGERTKIAEDVEQIGLVDGKLLWVSFLGDLLHVDDSTKDKGHRLVYDGEYALSSYDFSTQQVEELGRFPLIYEPDLYYSHYEFISFASSCVVMSTYQAPYDRQLVIYRPGEDLEVIETPLPIHELIAAGDVAYAFLYDEHRSDVEQGLYRFDLQDGSYRLVNTSAGLVSWTGPDLYVASDDLVFLVDSHPWLFGSWRTVSQIDPETGRTVHRYRI